MLKLLIIILFGTLKVNGKLPTGCLDAFRNAALQAHNDYRLKHSVGILIF